jgi:hypothetical protein
MVAPTHLDLTTDRIGTTTAPASGYRRAAVVVGRADFRAAFSGAGAFAACPVPAGATAMLPMVFVAVALFAAAFFTCAFFAVAFFAMVFVAVALFFAVAFFAVAFFAVAFAVAFFAAFLVVALRCPWVAAPAEALAGAFVASAVGRLALGLRVGLGPPIAPDGGLAPMASCTTWAARSDTSVFALWTSFDSTLRASNAPM